MRFPHEAYEKMTESERTETRQVVNENAGEPEKKKVISDSAIDEDEDNGEQDDPDEPDNEDLVD